MAAGLFGAGDGFFEKSLSFPGSIFGSGDSGQGSQYVDLAIAIRQFEGLLQDLSRLRELAEIEQGFA